MSERVSEQNTMDKILHAKIEEMIRFCGLTITDSLRVDVTDGLIHYMKLGTKEFLQQKPHELSVYDSQYLLGKKTAIIELLEDLDK